MRSFQRSNRRGFREILFAVLDRRGPRFGPTHLSTADAQRARRALQLPIREPSLATVEETFVKPALNSFCFPLFQAFEVSGVVMLRATIKPSGRSVFARLRARDFRRLAASAHLASLDVGVGNVLHAVVFA